MPTVDRRAGGPPDDRLVQQPQREVAVADLFEEPRRAVWLWPLFAPLRTVGDLHDHAMALADRAFTARWRGDLDAAREHARQALPWEIAAARRCPRTPEAEPSRAILYRSAASLAYQAGRWGTMGRLARLGLAGFPPPRERRTLAALERMARMKGAGGARR